MRGIGGNTIAEIQLKTGTELNEIGERIPTWKTVQILLGWLDLSSGEARRTNYNAKIEESSHVFICDYVSIAEGVNSESARLIVNNETFNITLIDNPMGLKKGSQLEIYLKYTGGQ